MNIRTHFKHKASDFIINTQLPPGWELRDQWDIRAVQLERHGVIEMQLSYEWLDNPTPFTIRRSNVHDR